VDYAEVLKALSSRGARFAVAGGFACLAHGCSSVRGFGGPRRSSRRFTSSDCRCPVLRREELIRLKRAAGREKDLVDVRELERLA
jgi:hypothetical protein